MKDRRRRAAREMPAAESTSPYQVLGLTPGASQEDIRRSYLKRVRQSPPERDPSGFKEIRRAYEVLKDGARRRVLDMSLYRSDFGPQSSIGDLDFPALFVHRVFRMLLASSDFRLADFRRDFRPMDEVIGNL